MIYINIGIDIGGNHIGLGVVTDEGEILEKKIYDYKNENFNIENTFNIINSFISEFSKEYDIETIGIGIPGIASNTHIDYTCNLPLKDIEVHDYIKTKLPIYISNDANCATIAEYKITDKEIFSNYALVTIGTGIGSGLILNGNLYTGTTNSAGEIGHMVIEKDGIECRCGRKGCFEKYASATALREMTQLDDLEEIFFLAERNEIIQRILETYLENLSEGLSNLINLYDLEMLVIGGSLSKYGDKFIPKLKSKMISKIYNKYTYDLNIKVAMLGNDAGIIGASLLNQFEEDDN